MARKLYGLLQEGKQRGTKEPNMSETLSKSAEMEISALAKLKDADIDTSVLPELCDWTQAARGRFCRAANQRVVVLLGEDDLSTTPDDLNAAYSQMDVGHLIKKMLDRDEEASNEFVRRSHRFITLTVVRGLRGWGPPGATLVDDLVNEVYARLWADEAQVLKQMRLSEDNRILGFLQDLASKLAIDHWRAQTAARRGGNLQNIDIRQAKAEDVLDPKIENQIFLDQIDHFLQGQILHRDRKIFLLHYRDGLTAKEISGIAGINLTVKGVESVLMRLTRLVRSRLAAGDRGQARR
jgi:DNA-directed RNA polymerase specialized sigma24 family protein